MAKSSRRRSKSAVPKGAVPKDQQPQAPAENTTEPEGAFLDADDAAVDSDAGAPASAVAADAAAPPAYEHDLLDLDADFVSESELRNLMSDWRRGRATRNLRQALSDGYVAVFSFVVIGAMVISALMQAQGLAAGCSTLTCTTARSILPWAALFGTLALTLAISRIFGPVVASAAEGFWLFEAPIRRSRILRGRMIAVIVVAGVVAAVFGALIALLTGSSPAAIASWAGASGLGAAGLTAFAASEQGADRTVVIKVLQWVAGATGLAALLGVVSVAAGWVTLGISTETGIEVALVVAALGGVLLVIGTIIALRRLDSIRRARLVSGGALVSGMQGAMFALDLGLMRDILVEREAIDRGHVRPTKGRGLGTSALVWRDVQRVFRFPKSLLLWLVSLVVPYAVGALGMGSFSPFVSGLVLMTGLVPLMGSLRVLSRTKGLARMFPFTTAQIRTAAMIVPAVLAFIWAIAAVPAFMGVAAGGTQLSLLEGITRSGITALAGLLAAIRWVTAKQVDFGRPMVATGMGAMPPGLIFNLVRGFETLILVTAPIILGWPPYISLIIAAIAFFILRGSFDMEEMQAMQAENQRQIAATKAGAKPGAKPGTTTTKTRIPPPNRR